MSRSAASGGVTAGSHAPTRKATVVGACSTHRSRRARSTPALLVAVAGALIALISGCTAVVTGSAVKSGGPGPPAADTALLDPGNYPRRPRPPLGTVADAAAGRVVEAHRMANNVVGPWEVDSALVNGLFEHIFTTAIPDAAALSTVIGETLEPIADAHHFVLGFCSGRTSAPPLPGRPLSKQFKALNNVVLRFPTPADASAAAAELAAKNFSLPRDDVAATSLPIPHYPDTVANIAAVRQGFEAEVFTAHGPYVLYQYVGSKDNPTVVAELTSKTLDLQIPLIDHFQATPVDQLAALPQDPTGLLARTVPLNGARLDRAAVYEPHAALHFAVMPTATAATFKEAGLQRMSVDKTSVLEAVDPPGAIRVVEGMMRTVVPWGGYHPMSGVNGLPSARCFDRGPQGDDVVRRYLCIAAADRYAFSVSTNQELDARQATASQYLMLTS